MDIDNDIAENEYFGSGRKAAISLYSHPIDVNSHRLRLLIEEKDIVVRIIDVKNYFPEEILHINPYGILPTLVDRDLSIYDGNVMMEYLDERYPHPPMMPTDSVTRARIRMNMHLIYTEWYPLIKTIENEKGAARFKAQKLLRERVLQINGLLDNNKFFLNDEYSLLDMTLAPILWRMKHFGIELPRHAKNVTDYVKKITLRNAWEKSLSEEEEVIDV